MKNNPAVAILGPRQCGKTTLAKHITREFDQAVINTLEVESLDETLKKIEKAGGQKVHGPNEIPGVGMHAYCSDIEGNLFGVLEPQAAME